MCKEFKMKICYSTDQNLTSNWLASIHNAAREQLLRTQYLDEENHTAPYAWVGGYAHHILKLSTIRFLPIEHMMDKLSLIYNKC